MQILYFLKYQAVTAIEVCAFLSVAPVLRHVMILSVLGKYAFSFTIVSHSAARTTAIPAACRNGPVKLFQA